MALTTAFNSALTGLTAASRATAVVSDNIANVMTDGYGRRSLELTSGTDAPGVRVVGVRRNGDPAITAQRRLTEAGHGNASAIADFHRRVDGLIGPVSDPDALGAHLSDFESSLITAASRPESTQRLDAAVLRASDLAGKLVTASDGIQQMRQQADASIDEQVTRLNRALGNVQELNGRITAMRSGGSDAASLLDQRQALVDEINAIVPVRQIDRDHGQIALYTQGGAILLDGSAAEIGFAPTHQIVAEMTVEGGALSRLSINGRPVDSLRIDGPMSGGTLAAGFTVRDDLAVSAQAELDAAARNLIERFEAPGLDATLPPGAPGLFTDAGAPLDPALEVGLSGRIRLNAAVDPAQGGASWRLRAGLGAATPGNPGDARQLQAFGAALEARIPVASGGFGPSDLSAADLITALSSDVSLRLSEAERSLAFRSASLSELTQMELADGVDTDAELHWLMTIEQAYAANARMIEVVDELMNTILRI